MDRESFVRAMGPTFEHSPWVADETWPDRPFASVGHLHESLCRTMRQAEATRQLALVRAHPDLVGREVLTTESTGEQKSAGLMDLSAPEKDLFRRYNDAYKERFGFPFVICARLNKKEAILAAFPKRLENEAATELATALGEIEKIARLRLQDLIE